MRLKTWILTVIVALALVQPRPAAADQRLIVRTNSLPLLQNACLLNLCKVVGALDGTVNKLFLVTLPDLLPIQTVERVLQLVPGVLDVEVDVLRQSGKQVPLQNGIPSGLNQRQLVNFFGSQVMSGYAQQPAGQIIGLNQAREKFGKQGTRSSRTSTLVWISLTPPFRVFC